MHAPIVKAEAHHRWTTSGFTTCSF
ncbi:hypothetical protein HBH99_255870, partial [Parastagonospora nodorum]